MTSPPFDLVGPAICRRPSPHRLTRWAAFLWLLLAAGPGIAPAQPALRWDDPPAPFEPQRPRTETDLNRLHGAALFAEGRLLFQRERFAQALQRYQRAFRYVSVPQVVLDEIVPLAFHLERLDEAARYARLADNPGFADPFLLRRLALHLTEQEDYDGALTLYQLVNRADAQQQAAIGTVITQFETGRLYLLTDQFEQAADAFAAVMQAIEQPPQHELDQSVIESLLQQPSVTFAVMAECFLQANRLDAAARAFRRAYAAKPDEANEANVAGESDDASRAGASPDKPAAAQPPEQDRAGLLAYHLARVAARRPDQQQALQHLQDYFQLDTDVAGEGPYQLLAQLLREPAADPQQARRQLIERLEQLHQDHPQRTTLGYYLADQYLAAGQLTEAESLYRQLMQQHAAVEGLQGLARLYQRQNNAPELLKVLASTVAAGGSFDLLGEALPAVLADQALCQAMLKAGEQLAERDASLPPQLALAIAMLAAETGNFEQADRFFALGMATGQADSLRVAWGLNMLVAQQYERAARLLQQALESSLPAEEHGELYYYLSAALAMQNKFDEALAAAQQAAQSPNATAPLQARPAWVLYLAGRLEAAQREYEQFLQRFADDYSSPVIRHAVREARITLSTIGVLRNQLPAAEEYLERVLDEFPGDITALNDLGYLWAEQGKQLHLALEMTRQAVEAEPDNAAYRDSYGWALFRLGRFDQAVAQLQRAAQSPSPDGVILDHLAAALLKSGDPQAARETWQQALEHLDERETERRAAIEQQLKTLAGN